MKKLLMSPNFWLICIFSVFLYEYMLTLCVCVAGICWWTSLVLVALVSTTVRSSLSDHSPVPYLTEGPTWTPTYCTGVLLSELGQVSLVLSMCTDTYYTSDLVLFMHTTWKRLMTEFIHLTVNARAFISLHHLRPTALAFIFALPMDLYFGHVTYWVSKCCGLEEVDWMVVFASVVVFTGLIRYKIGQSYRSASSDMEHHGSSPLKDS